MADRLVVIDDARRDLADLLTLTQESLWQRKFEALSRSWPHLDLRGFLQRYHSVEMGVGRALEAGGIGRIGAGGLDTLDQDALIFGYLSMRIARMLPNPERLAATIQGHLQKNSNLRSFLFELETLDTIQQRGFEVIPTDLMDQAQYDFLASRGDHHIAVECKHVSGDAGMVIPKAQALELFDRISGHAARHRIDITNTLIDIRIPARLENINEVSTLCFRAIEGRLDVEDALASVRTRAITRQHRQQLQNIHERNEHEAVRHASFNEILELETTGHLFVSGGPEHVLIFSISSAAANDAVSTIFKRLIADAKRQLPADLPGALMVEIADLEAADAGFFTRRPPGDPVGEKVDELFSRRPHVLGICFTAGARNIGAGHPWAVAGQGKIHRPSLIFRNRDHPQYDNEEVASVFGEMLR